MLTYRKLKLLLVLLLAISTIGCALAITEEYLGDDVATHPDDQSIEAGDNEGMINQ